MTNPLVTLRSNSAVNGLQVKKVGILLLFGFVALWLVYYDLEDSVGYLWMFCALVIMAISGLFLVAFGQVLSGLPKYTVAMNKDEFVIYHPKGNIRLDWGNIQRVDEVTVTRLMQRQPIGYIGIKLKCAEQLYDTIPLRLASRLMIEQKDLHIISAKQQCQLGHCEMESIIDQLEWKKADGERLTGVIGMYANRTELLSNALGFHVFISKSAFDLPLDQVITVIQCFKSKN